MAASKRPMFILPQILYRFLQNLLGLSVSALRFSDIRRVIHLHSNRIKDKKFRFEMEKTSATVVMTESINWKEIYEHLLPRVFHFFFYKLGDRFLAEELTAITFEKAWTKRETYRHDIGAFRFWLFGIAQKVAVDHFRKSRHEIPLDLVNIPSSQNVEKELETQVDYERLASILTVLSERERLLVSLKYGAELNNREITRQTGISESNVGTILFRAVAKLRQEWKR
jgi:RNA polymerase sigma-70 factor (ECF subfamily)